MNTKQVLIKIQMGCDERIPRNAIGYVADLVPTASDNIKTDRLNRLEKYVPGLVSEFLK